MRLADVYKRQKEQGLEDRYLIIQKIDEIDWYPCSTIPLVRVKITEDKTIPKTEKEIDELEYIQTWFTSYERRFAGFSALRPLKDQIKGMSFNTDEYGLLPEYMVSIVITSKNMTKGKLTYLGNYINITPPQNEFIPICKDNFPTVLWKNFEEKMCIRDSYMYAQQKAYAANKGLENNKVKSSMMLGTCHDQMLEFVNVAGKYDVTKVGNALHNNDYGPWQTAGLDYTDKTQYKDLSKNIYDLEGNVLEWTTEVFGTAGSRVVRGRRFRPQFFC